MKREINLPGHTKMKRDIFFFIWTIYMQTIKMIDDAPGNTADKKSLVY